MVVHIDVCSSCKEIHTGVFEVFKDNVVLHLQLTLKRFWKGLRDIYVYLCTCIYTYCLCVYTYMYIEGGTMGQM